MKSKKVQEFKETELGLLPKDWNVVKLRDILSNNIRHGIYKSKEFVNSKGVRILKMGDLNTTNWIGDQNMERVLSSDSEIKRYRIYEGNIIFARTSMMTGGLGNCGIVMKHTDPIVFDGNLLCAEIDTKIADPTFYFYYFKSKYGQNEIARMTGGTQSRNIPASALVNVFVIKISKSEQIKIGKILSDLDSKIKNFQNQTKILEQIVQVIFKSWFVDFDGVSEFVDSELGQIPKDWKILPLEKILEIQIGGDWGEEENFSDSIQVTCLRGTDFGDLNQFGYSKKAPLRWIKKSSFQKRTLTDKDILLATSGIGPIGKTIYFHDKINSLYKTDLMYTNFSRCLRAKTKEIAMYVEKTLEYWYTTDSLFQYVTGTSIPNFDTNSMLKSKILLPPSNLIDEFAKISNLYFETLYNEEKNYLVTIRDALIPKLMSGEIRV